MCFEVEMLEVRYVRLISKLKNKKQLAAEKLGDSKASKKVRLMLLDAKLQTQVF